MIRLTVRLHCGLDWEWKEIEVIADSKEIALNEIYKAYKFRDLPYSNPKEDSLEILEEEELNFIMEEK